MYECLNVTFTTLPKLKMSALSNGANRNIVAVIVNEIQSFKTVWGERRHFGPCVGPHPCLVAARGSGGGQDTSLPPSATATTTAAATNT